MTDLEIIHAIGRACNLPTETPQDRERLADAVAEMLLDRDKVIDHLRNARERRGEK